VLEGNIGKDLSRVEGYLGRTGKEKGRRKDKKKFGRNTLMETGI